jgi:site-specific DNA-adenine methylase
MNIQLPYPYFGGKLKIMDQVWQRLGDTPNFVDPFMGGNAPILSRPGWNWLAGSWKDSKNRIETVNDIDCYVANFWRAININPDEVAKWADWPVNEADLHARHLWLVNNEDFVNRMKTDPDYYDAKVAGWWVWGICCWIGGGWCGTSQKKQRPHLGGAGRGVHRTRKQRPHLTGHGTGVHSSSYSIYSYFDIFSARLRRVRVCCGDWSRVMGPTPTTYNGLTAIILDPPYSAEADRKSNIYAQDNLTVAHDVREWAIENGDNPLLRIALFGYEAEHDMPNDWECLAWKTSGGYGSQSPDGQGVINKHKERVWFSPHCLKVGKSKQLGFFEE